MKEKIILITGSSSGIGMEITRQLSNKENFIFASGRRIERLNAMESDRIFPLHMDITNDNEVKKAIDLVIAKKGKIDILINNAGHGTLGSIEDTSIEEAQRQFDVNFFGTARVTKAVLPHMIKQKSGRIINMSSILGQISLPMMAYYSASKHAVESFSDALRLEVQTFGIKVSIIEPSAVKNTEFKNILLNNVDRTNISNHYKNNVRNITEKLHKNYESALRPDEVCYFIKRAINDKNPRSRYQVGIKDSIMIFLRNQLGDRFSDFIITNLYLKS